jgi:Uma2 family endonuclease
MQNKVDAYLQAGVRLIWSIYMVQKFVAVYRLNDPNIKFLNLNDELDGEDLIPGFKLKVNKLFE